MGKAADKTEIMYRGCEGGMRVRVDADTVWLSQAQMVQLFGRERSVITKHINNALNEGEITEKSNVQILHIANSDKPVKIYDLDVVISVGYRVKSIQGTYFRRWATSVLREMLLRRVEEAKSIAKLNKRVEKVEGDVKQIKSGMSFLVKQLSGPKETPRPRIGFGVGEGEVVLKPYGKV